MIYMDTRQKVRSLDQQAGDEVTYKPYPADEAMSREKTAFRKEIILLPKDLPDSVISDCIDYTASVVFHKNLSCLDNNPAESSDDNRCAL